ncbi:NADH-flavin reductase [Pseudomonas sp. WN033]|nr:NADH-flavin reductase [Pseudomonas sp. WN033]
MKIAVYGAVGDVGKRVVAEALGRGHEVSGIVRRQMQLDQLPDGVRGLVADVCDSRQVVHTAKGQDLIISAVRPPQGREEMLVTMTRSILSCVDPRQRVLVVGGAARLRVPGHNGKTVLTLDGFLPASVVAIARACQAQYEVCLAETRAAWTYLSPPAMLIPGERIGSYRSGGDTLLVDADGTSCISMEDYAVALLDEAESAKHVRRAFTVGY